jgi:hypothetical protein
MPPSMTFPGCARRYRPQPEDRPQPEERKRCRVRVATIAHFASLGVTVERIMTDNGSCYLSKAFARACKQLGVKHIEIKPCTPQNEWQGQTLHQTALREWPMPPPSSTQSNDPACRPSGSTAITGRTRRAPKYRRSDATGLSTATESDAGKVSSRPLLTEAATFDVLAVLPASLSASSERAIEKPSVVALPRCCEVQDALRELSARYVVVLLRLKCCRGLREPRDRMRRA